MNVILISPGFPAEMPLFTRGLAEVGARVFGVGDTPQGALDPGVRSALSAYLQVKDLWQEEAVVAEVKRFVGKHTIDRIECLWEPGMMLAGRMRDAFGVPGLSAERSLPFRDKEVMKQVLDAAGVRTPHHYRATSVAEVRQAVERIGFPVIVKPISGAGSADTYPVHSQEDLEQALKLIRHVPEISVEEYIEGEEFTFDTVCGSGRRGRDRILFENVAWYRPKPLISRLNAWINPQAIALRDIEDEAIAIGRRLGHEVLDALQFEAGFTHMEWFRTAAGEAIFGEIGGRPPGGRLVHAMNYSCDIDLFTGWAEAVCWGKLSQETSKKYNAAVVFKRAEGEGIVNRIEGLDAILAKYGEHIVNIDLVKVGEPRRDWRKVIVGDGWVVCRHPNLGLTLEIADRLSTDLRIHAAPRR